jgi:poly-gamma-glutamate synthesis protein (capsule biosynthesis protein)
MGAVRGRGTMQLTIALAGDTMLGRGVGALLDDQPNHAICAPEVVEHAHAADLFVCNLECCISDRGAPWPDPGKPFFFRAPPSAATTLARLGVDAVTLANNHALDFGADALRDTLARLDEVGIAHAGAGSDVGAARRPATIDLGGFGVELWSLSDHPVTYAAGDATPGIAFAPLRRYVPDWLRQGVATSTSDVVVVSPHWGPNMVPAPVPHVRRSAAVLSEAGAAVIAGHSAHVFHGVDVLSRSAVLYDLGDFVDDYAVDDVVRNDLGLLWLVTVARGRAVRIDALPLRLEYGYTCVAQGGDRRWIVDRLGAVVRPRPVAEVEGLLRIELDA